MNERPSTGSGVVGYVIVLVGLAGFVLGCFLPYTSYESARTTSEVSISYYRLLTAGRETPQYVGGLLWLFAGAGIVAWIALAGLRLGHHARRQAPSNLVAATLVWSLPWFGALVSVWGGAGYAVGYWTMLVSIGLVVVGTLLVWVFGRQMEHEPDSPAGPEPPTEVPVG
jgi:hypothetical protein